MMVKEMYPLGIFTFGCLRYLSCGLIVIFSMYAVTMLHLQGSPASSMPGWMEHLRDKVQSSATGQNIKLFICKLIVNTEEVSRNGFLYAL